MSLATRCTSCGTAFRVVQDQLKVSEGWVRCGRCNAVFNALEGLFDLGRDVPTGWSEHHDHAEGPAQPAASSARPASEHDASAPEQFEKTLRFPAPAETPAKHPAKAASRRSTASAESDDRSASGEDDDSPSTDLGELLADPIDARLFGPRKRTEAAPRPAVELDGRDRVEFSDARFDSDLFADNAAEADAELVVLPATDAGDLPLESATRPEFVRRADRRARWESGPARAVLALGVVLATLALGLQVAQHSRDTIAARWPSLRAPLLAWCRLAQCRIEAPRHIEDVVVESTALTRAAAPPDAFVLSVTLRSRSEMPLVTPSVDLALTDATGRLVARRVLAPRDFNTSEVLPPRAEAGLQVLLTAGPSSVVGYTVEIFYP